MNRNKTFGLLLAVACFAGGELEMQAQWEERLGIKITLVTGEVKTHLVRKGETSMGTHHGWWPDYKENYKSIEIPSGFSSLSSLWISSGDGLSTLESVSLPGDLRNLERLHIDSQRMKTISIPTGLENLEELHISSPLETIHFPSGNAGRMTNLEWLVLRNTNIETLVLPDGLIGIEGITVEYSPRLQTIVFGSDTNNRDGVTVRANGDVLKEIRIPRHLNKRVRFFDYNVGNSRDWGHLKIKYLEDLNPSMEVVRRAGVMVVRWNAGLLYASEQPDSDDWRLVGGVELSPLRIPAVLEGKMFFQVKPQE